MKDSTFKLCAFLILFFSSITTNSQDSDDHFIIGAQFATISHQASLQTWADEYEDIAYMTNPFTIPKYSPGPMIGWEIMHGSFNTGFNIVWNRKSTKGGTYNNAQLDNVNLKLIHKYNHVEFPFFYFPKRWFLGFGGTMDCGYHKVLIYNEYTDSKSDPLKQIQLGSKLGLKFRTTHEKQIGLSGMIFVQTAFFTGKILAASSHPIRPTQIGFRLALMISAK